MPRDEMNASREDYLEAILILRNRTGDCHSIDVANFLNFSKPSVSNAVKKLEASELIYRNMTGSLFLTEQGMEIAKKMLERHEMLTGILLAIGVSPETAEKDACAMEHVLSEETIERLRKHG